MDNIDVRVCLDPSHNDNGSARVMLDYGRQHRGYISHVVAQIVERRDGFDPIGVPSLGRFSNVCFYPYYPKVKVLIIASRRKTRINRNHDCTFQGPLPRITRPNNSMAVAHQSSSACDR
jgi:hypothetical protein